MKNVKESNKGTRQNRVATEIKKVLSEFLLRASISDPESDFDASLISVSGVTVSACLGHAKIFVIPVTDEVNHEDCIAFLERHKAKFRHCVGSAIPLKYTPDLRFFIDNSFENASRIEELFKKLRA